MRRRDVLVAGAALSLSPTILSAGFVGTRRALLSGNPRVVNAFSSAKAKLQSNQNIVIFVNGDSTAYLPQAPYVLLGNSLAQKFAGTFTYYLWGEWNVNAPTGPKAYNAAVTTSYGAGPTITMYLAATPGQVAGYLWDASRKAAALDAIPTPDVAILHHGHNQSNFSTQATNPLTTQIGLFLAAVGMTSVQWPGVPQILVTQNPDLGDSVMGPVYSSMMLAGNYQPNLTIVDTYNRFVLQGLNPILYRLGSQPIIHPSDGTDTGRFAGGLLEANTLLNAFANSIPAASFQTKGWPSIAGTNLLSNGDFSSWTGAFPTNVNAHATDATTSKDTVTTFGGAAYSMGIAPNANTGHNATAKYSMTTAQRNAINGQTVSAAILYYQDAAQTQRAFFQFQLTGGLTYQQGDLINCWGNWYMAVWPAVAVASIDANAGFLMYPCFGAATTTNNPLRVQKISLVLGNLPNGAFP